MKVHIIYSIPGAGNAKNKPQEVPDQKRQMCNHGITWEVQELRGICGLWIKGSGARESTIGCSWLLVMEGWAKNSLNNKEMHYLCKEKS